jgi:hypothetical protein
MADLQDWLNNASVSAFLGAFVAFILVILTDARRRRRKLRQLRILINDNGEHASRKLQTVQTNLAMLRENRFVRAPVMKFPVDSLRQLRPEVIDLIKSEENRSIDALLYWMEATDGLLDEAYQESRELTRLAEAGGPNDERARRGERMLRLYTEAEKNLGHLSGMFKGFASRRFDTILNLRHEIK